MNLKELYESGEDVRDSQIPEEWKESFFHFITGQTCYLVDTEDGEKEFVYFSHDFRFWYHQNQTAIERSINIDNVINKKVPNN